MVLPTEIKFKSEKNKEGKKCQVYTVCRGKICMSAYMKTYVAPLSIVSQWNQ